MEKELGLYRIIQEVINNTLKHAEATEIHIGLEFSPKTCFFTYQDNGIGVDPASLQPDTQTGLGLRNMASRAELLNTKIDYQSTPQQGFRASLTFEI